MSLSFSILPDAGISETWSWLTDVITSASGVEARMSLRRKPRVSMSLSWTTLGFADRRDMFDVLQRDLRLPTTTPMWANSAPIGTPSAAPSTRLYFDPGVPQLTVGMPLVLLNPVTKDMQVSTVLTLLVDGCTITSPLAQDIDASWFVIKGIASIIENDAGFAFNQITGDLTVNITGYLSNPILRDNNAAVLETYSGYPVLGQTVLAGAGELFNYKRTLVDFAVGGHIMGSRSQTITVIGNKTYHVQRNAAEMDYWGLFLDTVRGSWKAFLFPTQLPDLTLTSALVPNTTSLSVQETYASVALHQNDAFTRIEIFYTDGSSSKHTITSSVAGALTITPALPNNAKVTSVSRISYLLKCRMADTCRWDHGMIDSVLSFGMQTTNEG